MPSNLPPVIKRARALQKHGKADEAERLLQEELMYSQSTDHFIITEYSKLLRREGRTEESLRLLTNALERSPKGPHLHVEMGWTNLELKNLEQAQTSFEAAVNLDPNNAFGIAGLAETQARIGNIDTAHQMLRYETGAPIEAKIALAIVFRLEGRLLLSWQRLGGATRQYPEYIKCWEEQGITCATIAKAGDDVFWHEAADAFSRAKALYPNSARAARGLELAQSHIEKLILDC